MKITRNIAAIVLALILLLVCSVPAFAEETGNNVPEGGAICYPEKPVDNKFTDNNIPNGGAICYPTNPVDNNFINNNTPNGGAIYYLQK